MSMNDLHLAAQQRIAELEAEVVDLRAKLAKAHDLIAELEEVINRQAMSVAIGHDL